MLVVNEELVSDLEEIYKHDELCSIKNILTREA